MKKDVPMRIVNIRDFVNLDFPPRFCDFLAETLVTDAFLVDRLPWSRGSLATAACKARKIHNMPGARWIIHVAVDPRTNLARTWLVRVA